jgi:hypothetical protein
MGFLGELAPRMGHRAEVPAYWRGSRSTGVQQQQGVNPRQSRLIEVHKRGDGGCLVGRKVKVLGKNGTGMSQTDATANSVSQHWVERTLGIYNIHNWLSGGWPSLYQLLIPLPGSQPSPSDRLVEWSALLASSRRM